MSNADYSVARIAEFLREFAPPPLAEAWDNTGLILGDDRWPARRVMTCLTLTEDVAAEAVREGVGMIVSHHPVLFKAVKRVTAETAEGRTILTLLGAQVAVYSPHTSFDSAPDGINQRLAEALGLSNVQPLRPAAGAGNPPGGGGRFGELSFPESFEQFVARVRASLKVATLGFVGDSGKLIRSVALACGSAAEFLEDAERLGCDVLLTGEARFHACLEARSRGISLVLAGHYATERPGIEALAGVLASRFPGLDCFASRSERDPLEWSTR